MAASRRLAKELKELMDAIKKKKEGCGLGLVGLTEVEADHSNILLWKAKIDPEGVPYKDKGTFVVTISFPAEYPFKPPKMKFETPIYHPNIDEKGQLCLPIISPENWKPATRTMQILESLISLVLNPEPEHPLRADVAEEYKNNRDKYMKKAQDLVKNQDKREDKS
ncbi:ubiquitin-conjugating enzyme E2 L3-like [Antedon mediterranea]|uniref:ubiquitin-conjugating enzyme E2 L3-like n=1 Tax=Antedon mediterranea TaxID=105859 RepID=UPI003AF6EE00